MDEKAEVAASYRDEQGRLVEVDDLGIGRPWQAGTYVVYIGGEQVIDFVSDFVLEPNEMIPAAKAALRDEQRA